jgi:hypothetical protein
LAAAAPGGTTRATLVGAVAIVLWSSLALLATGVGEVPPFQLVAMSFAIAAALAMAKWLILGEAIIDHLRRQPGCSVSAGCSSIIFSISSRCATPRRSRSA